MRNPKRYDHPPLLDLTRGYDQGITKVADFIHISRDSSNAHLVTSGDGDVLVNSGTAGGGARHKAGFAPHRRGALRYAVITQGHPDHFGGLPHLKEAGTQVIMQADNPRVRAYWSKLGPFYGEGLYQTWAAGQPGMDRSNFRNWSHPEEQPVDVLFRDDYEFTVGGRRFQLFATPGGETTDSCIVWLPDEKIVFTGNLFGPMWMNTPFINTLRGDKIREVVQYLKDVQKVRALQPEILITGHGNPVHGRDHLQEKLAHLHDAVKYIHDETVAGMNAGKDVYALMRDIRLPPHLDLGEGHGKVSWAVRGIFTYYNGWYDRTDLADMYHLPLSALGPDLVELAGGPDKLVERASHYLAQEQPLQVLRLTRLVLDVDAGHVGALTVRRKALEVLLDWSGRENVSETMQLMGAIHLINVKLGA